jgi:hypothetical protein
MADQAKTGGKTPPSGTCGFSDTSTALNVETVNNGTSMGNPDTKRGNLPGNGSHGSNSAR